jgi:tetratricopeptide (TPR) repeat protein
LDNAIEAFQRASAAQPAGYPEAHYEMGALLARKGQLSEALTQFGLAIKQSNGNYPEAHYQKGRLHARVGQTDAAIDEYRQAIKQRQGIFAEAYADLGRALYAKGDLAGANEAHSKAVQQRANSGLSLEAKAHAKEAEPVADNRLRRLKTRVRQAASAAQAQDVPTAHQFHTESESPEEEQEMLPPPASEALTGDEEQMGDS